MSICPQNYCSCLVEVIEDDVDEEGDEEESGIMSMTSKSSDTTVGQF